MRNVLAAAALSAVVSAVAPAAAGACDAPARPVVSVLSPTAATFASRANPAGRELRGRFVLGRTTTYGVMLGAGSDAIRWQSTISTLRPGRRYTVVAVVAGPGCRRTAATSFRTPLHDDTVSVRLPPALVGPPLAPEAQPVVVDGWDG